MMEQTAGLATGRSRDLGMAVCVELAKKSSTTQGTHLLSPLQVYRPVAHTLDRIPIETEKVDSSRLGMTNRRSRLRKVQSGEAAGIEPSGRRHCHDFLRRDGMSRLAKRKDLLKKGRAPSILPRASRVASSPFRTRSRAPL